MFVLGLLILAAAVVGAVEFVLANQSGVDFKLWNQTWHIDAFWLGVMGAGFVLALVIAVALMRMSMTRSTRLRHERRELAAENERLAQGAQQSAAVQAPSKAYPPPPAYGQRPPTAEPPLTAPAAPDQSNASMPASSRHAASSSGQVKR